MAHLVEGPLETDPGHWSGVVEDARVAGGEAVALMGAGFATGRSVVYGCVGILIMLVAIVVFVGRRWPERLQGPAPVAALDESSSMVGSDRSRID